MIFWLFWVYVCLLPFAFMFGVTIVDDMKLAPPFWLFLLNVALWPLFAVIVLALWAFLPESKEWQ